ncbi:MAG: helix-turn-helix transcriptional regulator [Treponema sp.]|nr:helix-turn-helix transcriptional regulator [Treponema sp.]
MKIPGKEPDDYRLTSTGCGFSLIKKSRAITNPVRHFHPWWEILYIESGERTFFYAGRTLHILAGTFLCIAPGILHRAVNPEGEVCGLYNVYFADDNKPVGEESAPFAQIAPLLQSMEPCVALLPEVQSEVTELFSKMGRELFSRDIGWKNIAWAYLSQIIVTVSRQKSQAGVALQPTLEMNSHIAAVIDYLNVNYARDVSLASVAERFGLSASHLSRSFKEATHFGFVEYVNSLRITKACRMLKDERLSVLEIAMECGFGSLTQFGRCFRSLTGTTPLSYRKSV